MLALSGVALSPRSRPPSRSAPTTRAAIARRSRSMLTTGDRSDVTVHPDRRRRRHAAGQLRFESIPDGIALRTRGEGRVDVYVNHETSTVPFPYTRSAPTEANSQNDFTNAQVTMLALNQHSPACSPRRR